MRGSHLHNRFAGDPTGLPCELNHTCATLGDGTRRLTTKEDGRQYDLLPVDASTYDSFDIGTKDGNEAANSFADGLKDRYNEPAQA